VDPRFNVDRVNGEGDMESSWLDQYLDAWLAHPLAGAPGGESRLKALLACCSPNVRYEDVPTGSVFAGHEGIRQLCEVRTSGRQM
jgi:hypothetical protein